MRDVAAVMGKLGCIAFGGPAVHVAMLRDETVRRRHWLDDEEFLELFGAVSVLPGPSSTQLAIALSRRRAGLRGLVIGGVCFIAPAMAIVLVLAWAYTRYHTTTFGRGVIDGVEPVVVAIVAVALWDLGRTALKRRWYLALGVAAAVGYFAGVNVLVVLLGAGLVVVLAEGHGRGALVLVPMLPAVSRATPRPSLAAVASEFTKLGLVVFGSGYVLLAFLRRDLVTNLHWLTLEQVLDAVAVGQVTPGPVFTTATFVGYLIGGVPAALVATAGIFVPSFVMVSAIEPLLRHVRRRAWATAALDGITVAALGLMVGVTADLGRAAIDDALTAAVAVLALAVIVRWRPNAVWLVLAGAAVGLARAV